MEEFVYFAINNPILIGLFLILLILLIWTESQKGGKNVTSGELTQLVNKQQAIVLDIRNKQEFQEGHIVHAIHIPHEQLTNRLNEIKKYQKSPIVLVCTYGQHSGSSSQILRKSGFSEVYRLKGGMRGWCSDNLPLVTR